MTLKIILIGICVCILNILLKQTQSVFTLIINIAYAVLVCFVLADRIISYVENLRGLFEVSATVSNTLACLFKGALICILTKLSSDICKENNSLLVSDIIDLSGRIMLLIIAYPFIESIIKVATTFAL